MPGQTRRCGFNGKHQIWKSAHAIAETNGFRTQHSVLVLEWFGREHRIKWELDARGRESHEGDTLIEVIKRKVAAAKRDIIP